MASSAVVRGSPLGQVASTVLNEKSVAVGVTRQLYKQNYPSASTHEHSVGLFYCLLSPPGGHTHGDWHRDTRTSVCAGAARRFDIPLSEFGNGFGKKRTVVDVQGQLQCDFHQGSLLEGGSFSLGPG